MTRPVTPRQTEVILADLCDAIVNTRRQRPEVALAMIQASAKRISAELRNASESAP